MTLDSRDVTGIDLKTSSVRLFEILDAKGITPSEVARFLGISISAVCAWRSQKKFPSMENLYNISEALGIPMNDFLVRYGAEETHDEAEKNSSGRIK